MGFKLHTPCTLYKFFFFFFFLQVASVQKVVNGLYVCIYPNLSNNKDKSQYLESDVSHPHSSNLKIKNIYIYYFLYQLILGF